MADLIAKSNTPDYSSYIHSMVSFIIASVCFQDRNETALSLFLKNS